MGHKLPMATILPTYLFLKPAQGGYSQLSCFIVFFSVGLTHPDNIHQQFHAGGLFQRAGARSQGACTFARLARAHARTPASYPSEGNHVLNIFQACFYYFLVLVWPCPRNVNCTDPAYLIKSKAGLVVNQTAKLTFKVTNWPVSSLQFIIFSGKRP